MLQVKIVSYEELEDHEGRIYTVYNVHVEDPSTGKSWYLRKRYKHFGYLHTALKDHFPQIEQYKFPNKSMFNTFSQHTKERRRSGFEDFLKLVVAIDPLPPEMEDFLELEDHLSNSGKDRSPMRPVPFDSERSSSGGKRPQMKESSYSRDSAYASVVGGATSTKQEYMPSSMQPAHSTVEQTESNNKKSAKLELRNILLSTFAVTTVIYALCIYIGVINISQSSQGRVVLTALSLGSTFSLLRISARRRQLRAKASSTQSPHSDK